MERNFDLESVKTEKMIVVRVGIIISNLPFFNIEGGSVVVQN